MKKAFMKTLKIFTSIAAVGFASITWAATPVAAWTDFNQLQSDTYVLSKDAACKVSDDGSITLGGEGLKYTFVSGDGMSTTRAFSVAMDITFPAEMSEMTLATLMLSSQAKVNIRATATELQAYWGDSKRTNTVHTWAASPASTRKTIVVTYNGETGEGTHVYVDGVIAITDTGLMASSGSISTLTIGSYHSSNPIAATGVKVHTLRAYNTKLSADDVAAISAVKTKDFIAAFDGNNTITGANPWSDSWNDSYGNNPDEYVATPFNQGFSIRNTQCPYFENKSIPTNANYTLAIYACLGETNGMLWFIGQVGGSASLSLQKTDAGVVLARNGNADVVYSGNAARDGAYHWFTAVVKNEGDTTSLTLYVDSEEVTSSETASLRPTAGLQLGAQLGGYSGATGTIIDEVYGWNKALTSVEVDALCSEAPIPPFAMYVREITGNADWSATDAWTLDGTETVTSIPEEEKDATVTVSADATLTVNADSTLGIFTITGDNTLTLATDGTHKLNAEKTAIEANTIVEANAAILGATTITSGKSLTVKDDLALTSVTQRSGSTLVYDLTNGTLPNEYEYNTTGATVRFAGTQSNTTRLGGTNGTIEIASGAVISVPHLRFLNNQFEANRLTFDVNGTINVTGITTNPYGDRNNNKGVLFGHWHGQGVYNINAGGFLNAENTTMMTVYSAEAQTVNVNGGRLKVRAIYAQKGTSTINLTNGGVLELASWPSTSAITQNYGYGTVKAYAYENSTGWTNPQAVTFTDADKGTTLDPAGLTMGFSGTLSGSGKLVVKDSAATAGLVDLSSATLAETLSYEVVAGKLKIPATLSGNVKLAGGVLQLDDVRPLSATMTATSGTIALTVTAAEIAAESVLISKWGGEEIPAGLTAQVTLPTGVTEEPAWSLKVKNGMLTLAAADIKTISWQTPTTGTNWNDGLAGFGAGDNVEFGANNAEETVTIPEGIYAGQVTIEANGKYAFAGANLSASSLTVEADGALSLSESVSTTCKYLRFIPRKIGSGSDANSFPGIAELILTKEGNPVAWPLGTTIYQLNADGTMVSPAWSAGGNEKVNALIDSVYSNSGNGQTYTNPQDGSTATYSAQEQYNKWWPYSQENAVAVIALGEAITFDGYQLVSTDYQPRSPKTWVLEVSMDGLHWTAIDSQEEHTVPNANSFYVYNAESTYPTIFPVEIEFAVTPNVYANDIVINGTITNNGRFVADTITFGSDSVIAITQNGSLFLEGDVVVEETIALTIPATATAAYLPIFETTDEDLTTDVFAPPSTHIVVKEGNTYYAKALGKSLYATLSSTAVSWEDLEWTTSEGDPIATPNFADGDCSITLTSTVDATLTLPSTITVDVLTIKGEKTLTLAGSKLTSAEVVVEEGHLVASETTLTLVPMNIASGKSVTYTTTTYIENTDSIGTSHAQVLQGLTGEGTFIKDGVGTISFFHDGPAISAPIVVKAGDLKIRGPEIAVVNPLNVTVQNGAILNLSAWHANFSNNANALKLEGGASLYLTNGSGLAGTITIENAETTSAKIYGMSFNAATVSAAITGAGKVEFADGGSFGAPTSYPCNNATTYSGVISDALQVIISDAQPITFTANNTYTGGTIVEDGAKLVATHHGALGPSGNIVVNGAGQLSFENMTAANGLPLHRITSTQPVVLNGVTGYLASKNTTTCPIEIGANGFTMSNGWSDSTSTFSGALTGSGTLTHSPNGPSRYYLKFTNAENFGGAIVVSGASHSVILGNASGEQGKIVIDDIVTIAKNWTATNGVVVTSNGAIGGAGSIGSALTLNSGATIDASSSTLSVSGTVTLPTDTINVVLGNEGLQEKKILSATTFSSTIMPTASIIIDDVEVMTAALEVREDGLYLLAKRYTRTFTGGETTWQATDAWTIEGTTTTVDIPDNNARVTLTIEDDTTIAHNAKIALTAMQMEGEGNLAFVFDVSKMLTQDNYLASPYTIKLLSVENAIDPTRITATVTGLKYGSTATVSVTEAGITVTISLPDSMLKDPYKVYSFSFAKEDGHQIADMDETGLEGYEVLGTNWNRITGGDLTLSNLDVFSVRSAELKMPGASHTEAKGALDVSRTNNGGQNGYFYATNTAFPILKGYIDDSGSNTVTLRLPEAEAAKGYTVILYAATDASGNQDFAHFTVNNVNYTAIDGKTVEGSTKWGDDGVSGGSASALAEGTNVLVITNQTSPMLTISENGAGYYPRGGLAGFQVIVYEPIYELVSSKTAQVTGDTTWADLEWVDDDGNSASTPTDKQMAILILENDATIDLKDAEAMSIQVVGNNHVVRFVPDTIPADVPFYFNKDVMYLLQAATEALPVNTMTLPGEIRYGYAFDATNAAYTTIGDVVTNFTAGFKGSFVAAGGEIRFSGGSITLSQVASSEEATTIAFTGSAMAEIATDMIVANATVSIDGNAMVTTSRLVMGTVAGSKSQLSLAGKGVLQVNGNGNGDRAQASIIIGEVNAPTEITISDSARLIAEKADMLVARGGNEHIVSLNGGELRVRGINLSSGAATDVNTLTLNLNGTFLIGEGCIGRYGIAKLILNIDGGTIGAFKAATLGADFNDMTEIIINNDAGLVFKGDETLTLTGADLLMETIVVTGGGLNLSGEDFTGVYALDLQNATFIVSEGLDLQTTEVKMQASTIAFQGGLVTTEVMTLDTSSVLEVPLSGKLSETGYLKYADVNNDSVGGVIGDLSGLGLRLVLDPNRNSTDRFLPMMPLIIGTIDDNSKPTKAPSVQNNTNNAVLDPVIIAHEGSLGGGYYIDLSKGTEAMYAHEVELPGEATQADADIYLYHLFKGSEGNDNTLTIENNGIKLYQADFVGADSVVKAQGTIPHTLIQANGVNIGVNLEFDLSAWSGVLNEALCGVVKDVPLSYCIVSGGLNIADGKTITLAKSALGKTDEELEALGVTETIEVTSTGIYYVLRSDIRRAKTISINFTNASTPLVAEPAMIGAYGISATEWNSLSDIFSTPELYLTDRFGLKALQAKRGEDATRIVSSTMATRSDNEEASLLKVWPSDVAPVTFTIENIPFDNYRVALIYSADLANAQFACANVNGVSYAMDGNYTRAQVVDYTVYNADKTVKSYLEGDRMWGQTKATSAEDVDIYGVNTLVTDVFTATAEDCTAVIALPALEYGQVYAGIAALQIIEAPAVETSEEKVYHFTFDAAGEYKLDELDLTIGDTTTTEIWRNGAKHQLVLTVEDSVTDAVNVILPIDFEAALVSISGGNIAFDTAGKTTSSVKTLTLSETIFTLSTPMLVTDEVTIPEGTTLILGEASKMSTNFDSDTPRITINPASTGTLRCNYPISYTENVVNNTLTFAWQNLVTTRSSHFRGNLLIEEGDVVDFSGSLSIPNKDGLSAKYDGVITQTGGTVSIKGGSHGFLLGSNDSGAQPLEYTLNLSGGRFEAGKLTLWTTQGATFNANVTNGIFALGGLNVNKSNGRFILNLSNGGCFELMASLTSNGADREIVNLNGGTVTTTIQESTLALPIVFGAAQDATPVTIDLPAASTLCLNAANTGSGTVNVTSGTLAIGNAAALGTATVNFAEGTAYEVRGLAADATITGTIVLGEGVMIKITNEAITSGTVRIAGDATIDSSVTLMLNGAPTSFTNNGDGTITLGTAETEASDLTWTDTVDEGLWTVGVATPWTPTKAFKNRDTVKFNKKDDTIDGITVKVRGTVAPAAMTFAEDVDNEDNYRFVEDGLGVIDLTGYAATNNAITLNLGSGIVYDVPIKTVATSNTSRIVLEGTGNTYRLIGALDTTGKTASLKSGVDLNNNGVHGLWANGGEITFAPHADETQILSPGNYDLTTATTVNVTGGGKVELAGNVPGTNWNGAFDGAFNISSETTLDFSMTRAASEYANPFFRKNGAALWMKGNVENPDVVGFTLTDGGILRFSGASGIIAGANAVNEAKMVTNHPIVMGTNTLVDYASTAPNVIPYGVVFNGDGATLKATRETRLVTGSSFIVAGVGDKGDISDPKTETGVEADGVTPVYGYGNLTEGIHAQMTGTYAVVSGSVGAAVTYEVGDGSTLAWSGDFTSPNDTLENIDLVKSGKGTLSLEAESEDIAVRIAVNEGTLKGRTTFINDNAQITVAAGATIEAGLSTGSLILREQRTTDEGELRTTFAIDPTGKALLKTRIMGFVSGAKYDVVALPGVDYPDAKHQLPIQVVAWSTVQNLDSVSFNLSEELLDKGYALISREDGLYLAKRVIYRRNLSTVTADSATINATWYNENVWWRSEDNGTTWTKGVNYAPIAGEAVVVKWVVPENTITVARMTLKLTAAVEFAEMMVEQENGTPVAATVTYNYDLSNETMPAAGEIKTFTWVPTLVVGYTAEKAKIEASNYPETYDVSINGTSVSVYSGSAQPALNISFGGATSGDKAWISDAVLPCGAVPFAGAYWNNASTTIDGEVAKTDAMVCYTTQVTPTGISDAKTTTLTYATTKTNTVLSRTNTANGALTASYLAPSATAQVLPEAIANQFSYDSYAKDWIVKISEVPFYTYDLYLIFAGEVDGEETTNPTVRVKVGDDAWRTYSYVNGWTTPTAMATTWKGIASPSDDQLQQGQHYLRIRVSTNGVKGALEVAAGSGATAGLAALQIVECGDSPWLTSTATGAWNGPAMWMREDKDGFTKTQGSWMDATETSPRPAVISKSHTVTANIPAMTPYIMMKSGAKLKGMEGYISTNAIDFTGATNSTITIEEDIFATPPMVVMEDNLILNVPEKENGTTTNRWQWIMDAVEASTTTLRKSKAGDLVLTNPFNGKLEIGAGTLWLAYEAANVVTTSTVTGAGTLGKKGQQTIIFSGSMQQQSATPIRVSEGTLQLDVTVRSLGQGKTFLADGGTLFFNAGAASHTNPDQSAIHQNCTFHATAGGRIIGAGTNRFTNQRPTVLADNGKFEAMNTGGNHVHCGTVILKNDGILHLTQNGGAWNNEGLVIQGDLLVEQGTGYLRRDNQNGFALGDATSKIVVSSGATLDANAPIWMQSASGVLVKEGDGTWKQRVSLFINGGTAQGAPVTIKAGTWSLMTGEEYQIYRDTACSITIEGGARFEANATFTEKSPVTIKAGATLVNGLPNAATTKMVVHTLALEDGAVLEFDLAKSDDAALSVTNDLTASGDYTIKLTNLENFIGEKKKLMAWPKTESFVDVSKLHSAEAIALDATFVIEEAENEIALYIDVANAAYKRDVEGDWSDELWWLPAEYTAQGAFVATKDARIDGAITLGVDTAVTAGAVVVSAGKDETLTLGKVLADEADTSSAYLLTLDSLWKIGEGDAVIDPVVIFRAGANNAALHVASGSLTLGGVDESIKDAVLKTLPVSVDAGATLALTSSMPTPVSGAGTIKALNSGATIALGTATPMNDHDLNYALEEGAKLTLVADIESSTRTATRKVDLGANSVLTVQKDDGLGYTPNMDLRLANEAVVELVPAQGVRLAGKVTVPSSASATIKGATQVPAAVTFDIDGTLDLIENPWKLITNEVINIVKEGQGTLNINAGLNAMNASVDIKEGRVDVRGNVSTDANGSTWSVRKNATLALGEGATFAVGAGSVTFAEGSILRLEAGQSSLTGTVIMEGDSILSVGDENGINSLLNTNSVTIRNVVEVRLNTDPSKINALNEIKLITSTNNFMGGGSFRLGGSNVEAWISAGWSLRQTASSLSLVSSTADGYTWAGENTDKWWNEANWIGSNPNEKIVWPTAQDNTVYSVILPDTLKVNDTAVNLSRSLNWNNTTSTFHINALRSEAKDGNGYTIGSNNMTMNISADLTVIGEGGITFTAPVKLQTSSSMSLLKGKTLFKNGLQAGETLLRPIAMSKDATLAIGGTKAVNIGSEFTLLTDGTDPTAKIGPIINEGSSVLTLSSDISQISALKATSVGTIALSQVDMFDVAPAVTLAEKATLAFTGIYAEDTTQVKMAINADAVVPAGILKWNAQGNSSIGKTPRLSAQEGSCANVTTFEYVPQSGRVTLEADGFFPETAVLSLASKTDEATALLLGKGVDENASVTFSKITGGGIVSVEPTLNVNAGDWSAKRNLTLKLMESENNFSGRFMGGTTGNGSVITLGVNLTCQENLGYVPRFSYSGTSNDRLGTFSINNGVNAEILGTWAGDVKVLDGGRLSGSGTLGAVGKTVDVTEGGIISAITYDKADAKYRPAQLTVTGELKLKETSKIEVYVDQNMNGQVTASNIDVATLGLPDTVGETGEVMLDISLYIAGKDLTATNQKILCWKGINGVSKVNGNLTVYTLENGNWVKNDNHPYLLRQESDDTSGWLKITTTKNHCILILQ